MRKCLSVIREGWGPGYSLAVRVEDGQEQETPKTMTPGVSCS